MSENVSSASFLRAPAVCKRLGVSRASIYAWIARGEFPAPVKLGPRLSAWSLAEIEDWERARMAARAGHSSEGGAA